MVENYWKGIEKKIVSFWGHMNFIPFTKRTDGARRKKVLSGKA